MSAFTHRPTFIVAEIGINHNGSIVLVKRLIDVALIAGCDAVKFQKRTVNEVYTKEFLDSPRKSMWGKTQRDQKEGLELSMEAYREIKNYCWGRILWFASPWDVKSVGFLQKLNVSYYKIASPVLTDDAVLKAVARTGKEVIMSTGMSTPDQIRMALSVIETYRLVDFPVSLLACTSTYPCPVESLNLSRITTLKYMFPNHRIGYSGHEVGLWTTLCAVAMGATIVERHITLDRTMVGSDHAASVEPQGMIKLVKEIRNLEKAMGSGKVGPIDSELEIMKKLRVKS